MLIKCLIAVALAQESLRKHNVLRIRVVFARGAIGNPCFSISHIAAGVLGWRARAKGAPRT
jgi:hypothetical protein